MYPKEFFKSNQIQRKKGQCFVIMPYANEYQEVYEIIRQAMESQELNLTCIRADDFFGGKYIMSDVLTGIAESEIIIADLTGGNPNVFYELGITHTVKDTEKVIMIAQDADSIPFDLKPFRSIIYKQNFAGAEKLKTDLLAAAKTVTKRSFKFTIEFQDAGYAKYKFPSKLFGDNRCLYDFEIWGVYFGLGGAKFELHITRYAVGEEPKEVYADGHGLGVGDTLPLIHIPYDLRLIEASDNSATFVLNHR